MMNSDIAANIVNNEPRVIAQEEKKVCEYCGQHSDTVQNIENITLHAYSLCETCAIGMLYRVLCTQDIKCRLSLLKQFCSPETYVRGIYELLDELSEVWIARLQDGIDDFRNCLGVAVELCESEGTQGC